MTAIREASTMYASLFSLIIFLILFESRYPRKRTLILTIGLMGPLMITNFILLAVLGPVVMSTLMLLTCSVPSLIFFWILAKHRDGRFFFTFCFADTIMLEIIDLTSILDFFLGNTYIFMAVARLILCPAVAIVFWKWIRPTYRNLQNSVTTGWYNFAAISLIFYVMMSMGIAIPTHITQRLDQLPVFVLMLILLPVMYTHIFTTLTQQEKAHKIAEQEKIHSLQVNSLLFRVEDFRASNMQLQQERHDFRHVMRIIAAFAENQDLEAIKKTAMEYTEERPESSPTHYCEYKILDAVLAFYLTTAKRKGIQVSTKMVFPDTLPVPNEADLAITLANALENAIQACESVAPDQRYIQLKSIIHPCFMLQLRNSFNGVIAFDDAGLPLSTRTGHGLGTRSIAAFCEKNNAFCEFLADGQEFTLRIVFHS